eukprot:TRINITY_DN56408_c0_g1_i1.p1 TRINITY_DN56408_c0_g1~~TRINITY_DN56408_c0_g1_i1.p1  ORF type:complete len:173 (-),score=1.05 TRINITY_DN56408_c0_g1_i1:92-610(-)
MLTRANPDDIHALNVAQLPLAPPPLSEAAIRGRCSALNSCKSVVYRDALHTTSRLPHSRTRTFRKSPLGKSTWSSWDEYEEITMCSSLDTSHTYTKASERVRIAMHRAKQMSRCAWSQGRTRRDVEGYRDLPTTVVEVYSILCDACGRASSICPEQSENVCIYDACSRPLMI